MNRSARLATLNSFFLVQVVTEEVQSLEQREVNRPRGAEWTHPSCIMTINVLFMVMSPERGEKQKRKSACDLQKIIKFARAVD